MKHFATFVSNTSGSQQDHAPRDRQELITQNQ